jgi:hypothetical protein
MHYKLTRTYLNEAVIVRSTGCDMKEVCSMYAKNSFYRVTRMRVICLPNAIQATPTLDFCFCAAEIGPYRSTMKTKNRGLVRHFIYIGYRANSKNM